MLKHMQSPTVHAYIVNRKNQNLLINDDDDYDDMISLTPVPQGHSSDSLRPKINNRQMLTPTY